MLISWLSLLISLVNANDDSLKLTLTVSEINIGHQKSKRGQPCLETCSEIKFNLTNSSGTNYILYNFNSTPLLGEESEEYYCKNYVYVAGLHVFVYNSIGAQVYASVGIPDEIDYKSPEVLESYRKLSRKKFRTSKQVIKSKQSFEFIHKIDFRDFDLTPGTYLLKILYLESPTITYQVEEKLIREDTKAASALVFTGCISSNTIKLIVK